MNKQYRYYYPTVKEHISATLKVLAIIACAIAFAFLFCSCESRSGQLSQIPKEKVVVLDSESKTASDNGHMYVITNYKVKRIDYGVVDWITIQGQAKYESGDTIYHRFIK